MYKHGDTIAALSTPGGRGAIAVLRLSGPEAIRIAGDCLAGGGKLLSLQPGRTRVSTVVDPADGAPVDEAVVTLRRAPGSFTGEDMVEISLHGGRAVVSRVLAMLIAAGARPASPGEFTLRAFVNRKMDLARAEAVAELIAADSRVQAELAARSLLGSVSEEVAGLHGDLLELLSDAEAAVEFPEDGTPDLKSEEALSRIKGIADRTSGLASTYREGRLISAGAAVVMAGRPNAGKSSLFNRMAGEDKAIVADLPGTTRDVLECRVEWDGMLVRLYDTAGLRESGDAVEMMGTERASRQIASADAVIYVIDGASGVSDKDLEIVGGLAGRVVVALNKSDLPCRAFESGPSGIPAGTPCLRCSALNGDGVGGLRSAVMGLLDAVPVHSGDAVVITNARHHALLADAAGMLRTAAEDLKAGATVDLVLEQLERAHAALGAITGVDVGDAVMERIFSKFCVGK